MMVSISVNAYLYGGSVVLPQVAKALSHPVFYPPPPSSFPAFPFRSSDTCLFLPSIFETAAVDAQAASKQSNGAKARVSGKNAFELYDTYGFPLEITQELAAAQSVDVDVEGFTQEMQVCFPSCLSPGSLDSRPSRPSANPHPNLPPQPILCKPCFSHPHPAPHPIATVCDRNRFLSEQTVSSMCSSIAAGDSIAGFGLRACTL